MRILFLSLFLSFVVHGGIFLPWQSTKLSSAEIKGRASASALSITVIAPPKVQAAQAPQIKTFATPVSGQAGVKQTHPQLQGELAPEYPWLSRMNEEEGMVELSFLVTPEGMARNIQILSSSGFKRLDEAAMEAIKNARFAGVSEEAAMSISLNFKLKDKKP